MAGGAVCVADRQQKAPDSKPVSGLLREDRLQNRNDTRDDNQADNHPCRCTRELGPCATGSFRPVRDGFAVAGHSPAGHDPVCAATSLSAEFVASRCDRQLQIYSLASGELVKTAPLPAGIDDVTAAPASTTVTASQALTFTTN
jgi:hypothetical protein